MKRIGNLFKKDMILSIKDIWILLELGFAVFIVLLLFFVVPKDFDVEKNIYIYDATSLVKDFTHSTPEIAEATRRKGDQYVESREEVIKGMEKDKSAVGMIITEKNDGTYRIEVLTQPYTKKALTKIVEVEMEDFMSIIKPPEGIYPPDVYDSGRVESLAQGLKDEIPFNQRIMPPIILYMVGIIGLFAMVSLVGQERSDATLRAFLVSPGSIYEFLLSKHLTILTTGFMTFSILYIPMIGVSGYPQALILTILTIIMGSCIGVILAVFFETPLESFLWVFVFIIILGFPAVSLFSPVFSPPWMKLIPSYHILFGLDAAMFPDNNTHIIWQGAGILAVVNVFLVAISSLFFSKRIRKEV